MTVRNVKYTHAEKLTADQRAALKVTKTEGLVAVESRNEEYERVGVDVDSKKLGNYILDDD